MLHHSIDVFPLPGCSNAQIGQHPLKYFELLIPRQIVIIDDYFLHWLRWVEQELLPGDIRPEVVLRRVHLPRLVTIGAVHLLEQVRRR